MPIEPLSHDQLYTVCDPGQFDFRNTAALEPLDEIVGQERAVEAVRFAIGMERDGYNLFAFGPQGTGKTSLVNQFLDSRRSSRPVPDDWAYVNNFADPHKPRALRLPPGRARPLEGDMEQLVADLRAAIPAAFEGEDYRTRKQAIDDQYKERHENILGELQKRAAEQDVAVIRTQMGLAVAPVRDGEVLKPEEYKTLDAAEQERRKVAMEAVQAELEETLGEAPKWEKEHREKVRELDREVTEFAVDHLIGELADRHRDLPEVLAYLGEVRRDVVKNAPDFLPHDGEGGNEAARFHERRHGGADPLRRYRVRVVMDNGAAAEDGAGAPVIAEDHPTLPNLLGRIEHMSQMGALVTDFTMIKGGALHHANGGYLVLDALKLLSQPFAWDALKRALNTGRIRFETAGEAYGMMSTVSLEPEPIPLDVKVILLGEPQLYYLLIRADPEFRELFKVAADFDTSMERTDSSALLYARFIATLCKRDKLRPFNTAAVARVVEFGARLADDAGKLSTHMGSINDLVVEADYWCGKADRKTVAVTHVQKAIDAKIYRSDRIRERLQEQVLEDVLVIDTEGARVGEVNGLAVLQLDHFSFGKPSRISCRVHLGRGQVVDIEREVALGGPLHTKGVLILSSYLASHYAGDQPLALAASLVFEQSYGGVDGDSASSAELYALLSAISEIPLKQSLAVTGSVDQHGRVQAIGGVNEKIEGFFDLCQARGLTGDHGVLIPAANRRHLMLRSDVVEAVRDGRFAVHAVATIDEGIEILTGRPAGVADEAGGYALGSVNRAVAVRLAASARKVRALAQPPREEGQEPKA